MKLKENSNCLSEKGKERYDRQIIIEDFGAEGQKKLKSAKALIAGAGGLGSPVAIYLGVGGVGELKIVDNDKVELSNLDRRILHWNEDMGCSKAEVAEETVKKYNDEIKVEGIDNLNLNRKFG